MRSASSRPKLGLLILILGALLAAAVAAAALTGASPSDIAMAAGETAPGVEIRTEARTGSGESVVTTTTQPEQLGTWLGAIAPTWYHEPDTADAAAYDVVATGLRTLYTVGTAWNGSTFDLEFAKYVDGTRQWERFYSGPAGGYDHGQVIAARGSAIYTAGRRDPSGADAGDVMVNRWNSAGDRIWTRAYDSGSHLMDEAVDVAVDPDGNVVVVGYSRGPTGWRDWVVIGYRPDGTRRYVKRYDGPAHLDDSPSRMLIDSAGRVYVAGYSWSASNGQDALVIKYSQAGSQLWAKRYNGTANDTDAATSLRARPGGGVYVCGTTRTPATGVDGLFLGYTGTGSRLFAVADTPGWGGTDAQRFLDLEVLPDGDIICVGYEYTSSSDHLYAIFDPDGIWNTHSASATAYDERLGYTAKDKQGGVYLAGTWGTATGSQIYVRRLREGGMEWYCEWPPAPTASYEPTAVAVNGVNAYVAGWSYGADGYDQCVLGYVY